jgi:maltose-binding protein MalE
MKKLICLVLALLISLLSVFAVHAEETGTVNLTDAHAYETAASLCFIEDTLYMLGSYGVYEYKDNALKTLVDLTDAYMYRYNQQRPEDAAGAAAWDRIIGYLFTDGKALYGLHPYTGQVFKIVDGKLNACAQILENLLYVEEEDFFREIKGITYAEEKLILLLGTDTYDDYEKTEIVLIDLKNQEYQVSTIKNVQSIAAGTAGKLLVYVEEEQAAIWQYDIATDTLEKLVEQTEVSPSGLAGYKQSVVYLEDSKVMLADENGTEFVKAYMPIQYAHTSTPSACSESGMYAYPYSNYVFLRDVGTEGEAKQTVLTLMGNVSSKTVIDFTIQNPDIAVVSTESMNPNELIQAAVSGDSGVDLFVLSAPGDFYSMKEKGYISALNTSEKLLGEASRLYPAMKDVVFNGDLLLGYPVSVSPKSWMINETKWNELNLGDYPKTYNELFEKIEMWLNEYAADYPEYTLADVQQMGLNILVLSMVEEYIHENEASGKQLTFDTLAFREMMKCVSDNAHLLSEENEQWGMPLMTSMYLGFGTCYTDSDLNAMILPPALDLNEDQSLYAEMDILAVNAASKNAEAAARFVEFCVENLSNTARYEMEPELNEPVESSTYYVRVAELQDELKDLAKQLEEADQETCYAIEEKILQAEAKLEQLEERKWEIDPKSIEIYRSAAENLKVSYKSPLLLKGENGGYESLRSVVDKYCTQDFSDSDINALIAELDRVATMVYLESM